MNKNLFSISHFVVLGFSFLLASCSDSPTSTGSDLLQSDNINVVQINSLTDSVMQKASQIKRTLSLNGTPQLLIGKVNNTEASALIDFFIFIEDTLRSDIINNNINIISSKIKLKNVYAIGDTSNRNSLKFSAFKVTSPWSLKFTSDSLSNLNYDQNNIAANLNITDTLTTFDIDKSLIFPLFQDTASRYFTGFYLKPDPDQKAAIGYLSKYGSADVSDIPLLEIIYEKPGVYRDTIFFLSEEDMSIITGDLPAADNENIYVQSGVALNSRIWFDLSGIPANSVINNAELTLTLDTTKSILGTSYQNFLTAYAVLDTVKPDSTSKTSATLSISKGKVSGNITSLVQILYLGVNHGLMLKSGFEYAGLEFFTIKSSTANDAALRPQLKIIYTNKK